jgi:hypothetical protein
MAESVVDVTAKTGRSLAAGAGVTSWQTPDGPFIVEHLAGVDAGGHLVVFWWSPRADWQAVDVTAKTGRSLAAGAGVTSWQTSNEAGHSEQIAGVDRAGHLVAFWWVSWADWQTVDLSTMVGQSIEAGSGITSWETPDGQDTVEHLGIVGTSGRVLVFWWSNGSVFRNYVVTQHNDNARRGAYLLEVQLTPARVAGGRFGRLYERTVEGDVYAQPLYVPHVQTPTGRRNLFFVATSTNRVYALDADDDNPNPQAGLIWTASLDSWRPLGSDEICAETIGTVGITSTPAIDLPGQTMYVVTRRWTRRGEPADGSNYLHALDISNGNHRHDPVLIQAADPASGRRFDARCQRNRPGLLLHRGVVYVAFGTFSCDASCPEDYYHGWVLGYRASDLQQVAVFCTSADGGGAGVWQSGNGLVSDGDSIYFETGNDLFQAHARLGDSFVKLEILPDWPGLRLAAAFTPSNAARLRDGDPGVPGHSGDTDLGSGGPMLLPNGRLIGGGKQGRYYVLDSGTLTLTQDTTSPDPVRIGEGFQAFYNTYYAGPISDYAAGEHYGPNIHGGPVYWQATSYIYQMPEKDFLKAFHYNLATGTVSETPSLTAAVKPPDGMPGGHSSLSANGNIDGVVWTIFPNADGQWSKVGGTMVAFDATTLAEIWRDREPVPFAKFNPPTIAHGRIIRPTFASDVFSNLPGKVIVYGLRPTGGPPQSQWRRWQTGEDPQPLWSIDQKHWQFGGPDGLLGAPIGDEQEVGDGRGRHREFRRAVLWKHGLTFSVSPPPANGDASCHDPRSGSRTDLESSIYWTPETGAQAVTGEIRSCWLAEGGPRGRLGYPIADEEDTSEGHGRMARFEHGEITWQVARGTEVKFSA